MAAAEAAKTEHGIMVQDTAWDGYEEIPSWIMQGYGTLVLEADKQLKKNGVDRPTHVFVQAGVGSLAGAVVGYFANKYPRKSAGNGCLRSKCCRLPLSLCCSGRWQSRKCKR